MTQKNKAQNIYDNPEYFENYMKMRKDPDNANNTEGDPAIISLLPDVKGKRVLDLGCGTGEFCALFKKMGAAEVVGVDVSKKMLGVAKNRYPDIKFICSDIADLKDIPGQYGMIFSSMAIHYLPDFNDFCAQVSKLLYHKGYFIFSQEHPIQTAPLSGDHWVKDEKGKKLHFKLTHYSQEGRRDKKWFVDGVIKYHRQFSSVVNALADNGLSIERMLEPAPCDEEASALHKPHFLIIRSKKI
jgi:SAM-dependent methyltransferase